MSLKIENLTVSFDNKTKVLENLDLDVKDGEFVSLLGESGCGKSTLLKSVAGLIEIDKGSIFIDDKFVNKTETNKRGAVILFQEFRLFPHMTVLENVTFSDRMVGNKGYNERAKKLLERVKLISLANRYPKELSGGQKQRVALARALAANPKLLLLDEPFSSLDSNLRKDMRKLVSELQKEFSLTTVLVTHDKEEAMSMSDRVAVMHSGKILQFDTPEKIYNNPNSVEIANYFEPTYYIDGVVENGKFNSNIFSLNTSIENGNYKLMIRPEMINVERNINGDFYIDEILFCGSYIEITIRHKEEGISFTFTTETNSDYKKDEFVEVNYIYKDIVLFKTN